MLRRTALAATALVAATALALTACSGESAPAPTATGTPDADASVAIRLVLEPGNLDIRKTAGAALDQILVDNIYQGLVSRTPEQEIVPALASDFSVSADGLTYTFQLRDDASWSDGTAVVADHFVAGIRRTLSPETGSAYAKLCFTRLTMPSALRKGNCRQRR